MTENSEIFKEDMEWICKADLPWEKLRDSTVLVTGGTGLIGMTVINALIRAGRERGLGLDVCAVVRDTEKAKRVLGKLVNAPELRLLAGTMQQLPSLPEKIDYWIHGACPTAAGTAVKVVTASGFAAANLAEGTVLYVLFTNPNTVSPCSLDINGTGQKTVTHGQSVSYMWGNNSLAAFVFENNGWRLYGNLAYTNRYGAVMLVNTIDNLATTFKTYTSRYSITPKLAYDLYIKTLTAPRVRIHRGYDARQQANEYIVTSHPMNDYDNGLTGCFVLMMYSKRRRRRVTARGASPLKAKIKEGWGEARGALATNTAVTWTASMATLDWLRGQIIQRYVTDRSGNNISTLSAFKSADMPVFGNGYRRTAKRSGYKNNRLFGVAWRIENPEYVAPQGERETTHVDANGNPRYFYSEVAPFRVWINRDNEDNYNAMGFQVAPYKDGRR